MGTKMKKMLNGAALLAVFACAVVGANEVDEKGGISIGVDGGTLGLGISAGYDLPGAPLVVRGRYGRFDYGFDRQVSGNEFEGDLELQQFWNAVGLVPSRWQWISNYRRRSLERECVCGKQQQQQPGHWRSKIFGHTERGPGTWRRRRAISWVGMAESPKQRVWLLRGRRRVASRHAERLGVGLAGSLRIWHLRLHRVQLWRRRSQRCLVRSRNGADR